MTGAMAASHARFLYDHLAGHGVRCWVMGGWGVDALLGHQTRPHKDLDLLVQVSDLPLYSEVVRGLGFERKLEWSESRPIEVAAKPFSSAFVDAHPDGRELDVHVVDADAHGGVAQFHADPWPLPPDAVSGTGMLDGAPVPCVSHAAQLAMHTGYKLPDKHREDVRRLREGG